MILSVTINVFQSNKTFIKLELKLASIFLKMKFRFNQKNVNLQYMKCSVENLCMLDVKKN